MPAAVPTHFTEAPGTEDGQQSQASNNGLVNPEANQTPVAHSQTGEEG